MSTPIIRTIETLRRAVHVDHDEEVPVLPGSKHRFRPRVLWMTYERDCCPARPGETPAWQLCRASLSGGGTGALFETWLDLPEPYLGMARADQEAALPLLAERVNGAAL